MYWTPEIQLQIWEWSFVWTPGAERRRMKHEGDERKNEQREEERKKDQSFFSMSVELVCGLLLLFYSTNEEETHDMLLSL